MRVAKYFLPITPLMIHPALAEALGMAHYLEATSRDAQCVNGLMQAVVRAAVARSDVAVGQDARKRRNRCSIL